MILWNDTLARWLWQQSEKGGVKWSSAAIQQLLNDPAQLKSLVEQAAPNKSSGNWAKWNQTGDRNPALKDIVNRIPSMPPYALQAYRIIMQLYRRRRLRLRKQRKSHKNEEAAERLFRAEQLVKLVEKAEADMVRAVSKLKKSCVLKKYSWIAQKKLLLIR